MRHKTATNAPPNRHPSYQTALAMNFVSFDDTLGSPTCATIVAAPAPALSVIF